jgi:hypothetical protein
MPPFLAECTSASCCCDNLLTSVLLCQRKLSSGMPHPRTRRRKRRRGKFKAVVSSFHYRTVRLLERVPLHSIASPFLYFVSQRSTNHRVDFFFSLWTTLVAYLLVGVFHADDMTISAGPSLDGLSDRLIVWQQQCFLTWQQCAPTPTRIRCSEYTHAITQKQENIEATQLLDCLFLLQHRTLGKGAFFSLVSPFFCLK